MNKRLLDVIFFGILVLSIVGNIGQFIGNAVIKDTIPRQNDALKSLQFTNEVLLERLEACELVNRWLIDATGLSETPQQ